MKRTIALFLVWGVLAGCKEEPYDRSNNGHGGAVFYTTSNANGRITVSVEKSSFVVPVTTDPAKICEMGYTGFIVLTVGNHKYTAVAENGKRWEGTVNVLDQESYCTLTAF